ncbi:MAG: type II toxin-antitoxin system Phd/YefM family antitoxin [Reyranella sp.]|uniref:type II toxin-antitoxin system Phd/YefM family antitoxin n=1 Tax=Reyranella sp. TaxID=1929291 RepID=UPI003D09ECDE
MPVYTIHTAKTNLSKLIARAEAGEEVVLARGKAPIARIVPIATAKPPKRKFGALKGKIRIGPEFLNHSPRMDRGWAEALGVTHAAFARYECLSLVARWTSLDIQASP